MALVDGHAHALNQIDNISADQINQQCYTPSKGYQTQKITQTDLPKYLKGSYGFEECNFDKNNLLKSLFPLDISGNPVIGINRENGAIFLYEVNEIIDKNYVSCMRRLAELNMDRQSGDPKIIDNPINDDIRFYSCMKSISWQYDDYIGDICMRYNKVINREPSCSENTVSGQLSYQTLCADMLYSKSQTPKRMIKTMAKIHESQKYNNYISNSFSHISSGLDKIQKYFDPIITYIKNTGSNSLIKGE